MLLGLTTVTKLVRHIMVGATSEQLRTACVVNLRQSSTAKSQRRENRRKLHLWQWLRV